MTFTWITQRKRTFVSRQYRAYLVELVLLHRRCASPTLLLRWTLLLQALPEDKKPLSSELFWLAFRLRAGLPISPRDRHVGEDSVPSMGNDLDTLFESNEKRNGNREMALLMLCSFAEGSFKRPKAQKFKVLWKPVVPSWLGSRSVGKLLGFPRLHI